MDLIESNLNQIQVLCAKHRVKNLFVFGSVLGETFNSTSDVDFLVDFNRVHVSEYADNYFDLKEGTIVTMNQTDTFDQGDKQIRVVSANEWLKLTNML